MELFWRRGAGWFVEGVERRGCMMGLQGARVRSLSCLSGKRAGANHCHRLPGRWGMYRSGFGIVRMTAKKHDDVFAACSPLMKHYTLLHTICLACRCSMVAINDFA